LLENPAMSMEMNHENRSSVMTRSPLINETFQKQLESVESEEVRKVLMDKLVDEAIEKETHRMDFATRIRPDLHRAILDTIAHYGWKDVIYMYSTSEGKCLL